MSFWNPCGPSSDSLISLITPKPPSLDVVAEWSDCRKWDHPILILLLSGECWKWMGGTGLLSNPLSMAYMEKGIMNDTFSGRILTSTTHSVDHNETGLRVVGFYSYLFWYTLLSYSAIFTHPLIVDFYGYLLSHGSITLHKDMFDMLRYNVLRGEFIYLQLFYLNLLLAM